MFLRSDYIFTKFAGTVIKMVYLNGGTYLKMQADST